MIMNVKKKVIDMMMVVTRITVVVRMSFRMVKVLGDILIQYVE
jgi:hypothetical protein